MLNKTEGETLPVLGRGKVVKTEKWSRALDMLQIAADAAAMEFVKKGAGQPIEFRDDNILVMEYHLQRMILFMFWMPIKGLDHYYWYQFKLSDQIVGEFVASNMWPAVLPAPSLILQ